MKCKFYTYDLIINENTVCIQSVCFFLRQGKIISPSWHFSKKHPIVPRPQDLALLTIYNGRWDEKWGAFLESASQSYCTLQKLC